ncbi:MAG TPA: hypothetical protein VD929_08145 [Caulobacteraceae bacterium]|nr:hypothetical protein [Caulobacteraceae bacterium]
MTSPVRPGFVPPQTPRPQAADARVAAQRAFFEAAMGQARAAAAPQTPPARPTQATVPPARAEPAAAPERLARPGSLLDIRV